MAADSLIIRGAALPDVPEIGLGEFLHHQCLTHKSKRAVIDPVTNVQLSYEELNNYAVKLAVALSKQGVQPGDVVGLCAQNTIYYPGVVLAGIYLGAVVAPYSNSYSVGELEHMVTLTKPKVIFCTKQTRPTVTNVANKHAFVKDVVLIEKDEGILSSIPRWTESVTHYEVAQFRVAKVAAPKSQEVLIMSSSGTTGLPKGVLLSHYNVIAAITVLGEPGDMSSNVEITNAIAFLPMYHVFGLIGLLGIITKGATIVVLEGFQPQLFLQVIQDYKIRALAVVPPILNFLIKHPLPTQYDLSSIEEIGCGAAPASKEMEEEMKKRYPNLKIMRQGYGLTESTLAVLKVPCATPKPGSVGVVVPGIEIKVVDPETNKSLGPNKPGEICVRGPLVMKGYIGNPKATAETVDKDGWLHTGDIGYYDNSQWFYIVERLKELIKYKGFQVPPAELEAILMTHPAVLEAAVIGIPDKVAGELPKAYVVQKGSITEKEIQQYVASRVSKNKHLRGGVEFIDMIPKSAAGKILRKELRIRAAKATSKL